MHICEIKTADIANGVGMRVSLFVSGCTNRCKGCFQPETWDFNFGVEWSREYEDMIVSELSKPYYTGLSLLGGEPFEPENQRELVKLLRRVKEECPERDIWCYTGFVYENLIKDGYIKHCDVTNEMLSMIDMLVDGPYVEEKRNIMLTFRGSENQRIIDLNKTRQTGIVALWDKVDQRM